MTGECAQQILSVVECCVNVENQRKWETPTYLNTMVNCEVFKKVMNNFNFSRVANSVPLITTERTAPSKVDAVMCEKW